MSIEVELNVEDYTNIMNWFELAFGKKHNASKKDNDTLSKVIVMSTAYTEQIEAMLEDED